MNVEVLNAALREQARIREAILELPAVTYDGELHIPLEKVLRIIQNTVLLVANQLTDEIV